MIDASIPLQFKSPEIMTPAQGISLQNIMSQNQLHQLDIAQKQKEVTDLQKIGSIVGQDGSLDPDGHYSLKTIKDISSVNFMMGQKAADFVEHSRLSVQQQRASQAAMDYHKMETAALQKKTLDSVMDGIVTQVDALGPMTPEQREAKFQEIKGNRFHLADQTGELSPFDPKVVNGLRSNATYQQTKGIVTTSKELAAQQEKAIDNARQDETPAQKAEIAAMRVAGIDPNSPQGKQRQADALKRERDNVQAKTDNAAERLQIQRDRFELAQAQAEQKKNGESGREAVFTNRMVTSANEAVKGLGNIVHLPMTASTGWLGGRGQQVGIMNAAKEVLANKVTGEEAQLFNVMTAGITRNLASVEAVGLMPSGSLTHQMDSVIIKEGDTHLVKAAKLAEIRQILEGGLEPLLANPRVAKETKEKAQQILDQAIKAVPFTQMDVIAMMQTNDPKATLGNIVRGAGPAPAAGERPTPKQAPRSEYKEGQIAVNPKTGDKVIFRNGAFVPIQTRPDAPQAGALPTPQQPGRPTPDARNMQPTSTPAPGRTLEPEYPQAGQQLPQVNYEPLQPPPSVSLKAIGGIDPSNEETMTDKSQRNQPAIIREADRDRRRKAEEAAKRKKR